MNNKLELKRRVTLGKAIWEWQDEWQSLYEDNYNRVYKTALKIVKDKEIAKDVTQETFFNAFFKIGTLKDKNKFSAWICSISCNIAKNTLKQKINNNANSISLEMIETNLPEGMIRQGEMINPETLYEEYEAKGRILNLIKELDTDEQMVLYLKYFEGFTYIEIAKQINIKVGTIRMKALRAREKIYEKLRGNIDTEEK